jgi:hypothetical protein
MKFGGNNLREAATKEAFDCLVLSTKSYYDYQSLIFFFLHVFLLLSVTNSIAIIFKNTIALRKQ